MGARVKDVREYGPSPGCAGCRNAMMPESKGSVNQSEECRKRMEQMIEEHEPERKASDEDRIVIREHEV